MNLCPVTAPTPVSPVRPLASRPMTRVLLLAGTTEATELAERLDDVGVEVISSFAGVTRERRPRPGRLRLGGYGGAIGLADYIRLESVDIVVDATHPFAAQMPFHVAAAADATGIERCRVLRPAWVAGDNDRWTSVVDLAAAPAAVRALGARRVLLTTGRQGSSVFGSCDDLELVVRSIEAPIGLPDSATIVLDRGPFDVDAELALMRRHGIDVVVAKNAGSDATAAKLVAARRLGLPVVMIDRPAQPDGHVVATVAEAMAWVMQNNDVTQS